MASRKEEKERLRQARMEAEQREASAARRRLWIGYAVAGVLTAAVVAGIVIVVIGGGDGDGGGGGGGGDAARVNQDFGVVPDGVEIDEREAADIPAAAQTNLEVAARRAGCELRTDLPDDGNNHFTDEDRVPDYSTSPPASGDHYGTPTENASGALADGAYLDTPSIARAVHALEHGRVMVNYSPELPESDQLELLGLFDEDASGMLLFPNPDMQFAVAATAWQQLLGCEEYEGAATLDALRAFRSQFRGRGPEPVPIS